MEEWQGSDILVMLQFHSDIYGPRVAEILALDDAGGRLRPMELFPHACASETARETLLQADAGQLFPGACDPQASLSGLFLYFSCLKEAHELVHKFASPDGAYWHGIMHRMEGDAWNAGYWFERVGRHPIFPALQEEAAQLGYSKGREWEPSAFIEFCQTSAKANDDDLAKRVQLAEWRLLFEYCAARVPKVATR